jgi:hypothetical protein
MLSSTSALRLLDRRLAEQPDRALRPENFRPNLVLDGLDGDHDLERLEFDTPDGPVVLQPVGASRCGQWPRPAPGEPGQGVGLNLRIVEGLDRPLTRGATGRATLRD